MMIPPRISLAVALLLAASAARARPIEFDFLAPNSAVVENPFAREIWAEVITPSGATLTLPAYYADGGIYAVRARPEELGTYRFGRVAETTLGIRKSDVVVTLVSPPEVENTVKTRLPAILLNPRDHRLLMRSDGAMFVPVGANLAYTPEGTQDRMAYYARAIPEFAHANLNWMRIWMASWTGLNLDWLPEDMGPSPKPGALDEQVAENWDQILSAAEENGVYIQVVLQHHGQFSTTDNPNWPANPWNAANAGGFLKSPVDFFTDANARLISVVKYRYIVARWGWSPAVVAWELFNDVRLTDAMMQGHEADVARWHDQMADFIRSVDVYGHLITTGADNLRSPIYRKMDFYQPHLHAANPIACARSFDPPADTLDKPVFYGEVGDDRLPVSVVVKKSGLTLVPPIWASIMGQGAYAAQPSSGARLLETERLGELGAVYRFMVLSRITTQTDLKPFSAKVECPETAPLRIPAGQFGQRRASAEINFPVDGRAPIEEADIPAILSGSASDRAAGYPNSAAYRIDFPAAATVRVIVDAVAPAGGGLRVSVDGHVAAAPQWPGIGFSPAAVTVPVDAGSHVLTVENPGPDWIAIPAIELGIDASVLAAIGRRNDHYIAAWVWHRNNLFTTNPSPPVSGTLDIDDVPAGSWKVTWWHTLTGEPSMPVEVEHPGGTLRLQTPAIERHAAVVLVRAP